MVQEYRVDMKHSILRVVIFFILMSLTTVQTWAGGIPEENIIIQVLPENSGNNATIESIGEKVNNKTKVTIRVTKADSYTIYEGLIQVVPMIILPNEAPRRAPGFAGSLPVSHKSENLYSFEVPEEYDGAYVTARFVLATSTTIYSLDEITDKNGQYTLGADISGGEIPAGVKTDFAGSLNGNYHKIYNLSEPLFESTSGAKIYNLMLEDVHINGIGNVGAITRVADEATRIYNCGILSGSISGSGYVGGLVGKLDGTSRVINCFSYADVSGGTDKGGIVGYNNYASKNGDIKTMVMNCMFYGDISSGGNISPVYGGLNIDNLLTTTGTGLNTFNYYRYDSPYSKNGNITTGKYNCALAVEEEYLTRVETYRQLLNSNRRLAAYYALGDADKGYGKGNEMAKWVLETADQTNSNPKPYPVLKPQYYYHSIVNYDADHAPQTPETNKSLTINFGTSPLPITDKDPDHYNFNYHKVQLPYYDGDNYKDGKVVVGWQITSYGTSASEGDDVTVNSDGVVTSTPYNFADRMCTTGRVYSQGAYLDVPKDVTSITLEPKWANAVFVADANLDKVYSQNYCIGESNDVLKTPADVLGTAYTSGNRYTFKYGDGTVTVPVYTDISTALSNMPTNSDITGTTVYDKAVVLVGNLHLTATPSTEATAFTIMSADFDKDHEPDFSLIYTHPSRATGKVSPIRFDFLNMPGMAMAQKPRGSALLRNVSIFKPTGWFEVTNTCLVHFVQFEYDDGDKTANIPAPVILLGGVYDQFVSTQSSKPYTTKSNKIVSNTSYIYLGGNAWFKEFGNGTHSDGWQFTPHVPISVSGGDFGKFYLSGTYRPDAMVESDNAECYISGGRFGELAGAGQQQIDGNVYWQIRHADIDEFYGGGINAGKPITGDINIDIKYSNVKFFCGGPKFGDMQKKGLTTITWALNKAGTSTASKTKQIDKDGEVTTNAEKCNFGNFYGAGYGGNSYYRVRTRDTNKDISWSSWQADYTGKKGKYSKDNNGIATDFDYEYFVGSDGTVYGRFYVQYASFSMAQTNNVTSTLTDCKITGDFFGGGCRGKVIGKATSTLIGCRVDGNVFGGGYSASVPTIGVRQGGFASVPTFISDAGVFGGGTLSSITDYTWTKVALTDGSTALSGNNIATDVDLSSLGQVKETDLKIQGNTTVGGLINGSPTGGVFGGGDASAVYEKTKVTITKGDDNTTPTVPNVFGGGNQAGVFQNAEVKLENGTISDGVYGGCNTIGTIGGNVTMNLEGGSVTNNVFGGGKGQPTLVNGSVLVNVGKLSGTDHVGPAIGGDVYGGSALGNVNALISDAGVLSYSGTATTQVNLIGGTITGSLYGGGLGALAVGEPGQSGYVAPIAANVYGPVTVTVEGGKAANVFGCNNLNGTPKSTVEVTVTGTDATVVDAQSGNKTYALQGVYGGGNLAHFDPTTPGNYPTVTISGCATSIKDVFGGGNAAAVPYTRVTINGGDIDRVFAGGNGESGTPAHVGYMNTDASPTSGSYGAGTASALIAGGTIRKVFGGSNANGTIRESSSINVDKSGADGACDMKIGEVYGGGNEAAGGASTLTIGCTGSIVEGDNGHAKHPENIGTTLEGIGALYGGANAADVTGNISLAINSGIIANVYGGNNTSGSISGTIAVNIEKTNAGCGWYVGNVFGGGNLASYTGSPTVTVKNGTVSGNVYGGGNGDPTDENQEKGSTAAPTVTIGDLTHVDAENNTYTAIVLGDVYGGGNAAKVTGETAPTVLVQKCNTQVGYVYGGGNAADVPATHVTIDGGTISHDVFGGGHGDNTQGKEKAANVTGNVSVSVTGGKIYRVFAGSNLNGTIGGTVALEIDKSKSTATTPCDMMIGEVYGGGNQAAGNAGTITIGCTGTWTTTGDNNHTNHNSTTNRIGYELEGIGTVYGGAKAANIGTSTVASNISLTIVDGIIENVYGGNNTSGVINGTIAVTINQKDNPCGWYVGNVFGGGNEANYSGTPTVTVTNGQVSGSVFGGGNKANVGGSIVNIEGGGVAQGVYGGCNTSGTVTGTATVTVTGGTIGTEFATPTSMDGVPQVLFGGGKGKATVVTGKTTLNVGTLTGTDYAGTANIYGNVYGGSENGTVGAVDVKLYGNYIYGNVFGGGYDTDGSLVPTGTLAKHAPAAGAVNILLDGTEFKRSGDYAGNQYMAQVFGCNNKNGTPTGHVKVNVKRTIGAGNNDATRKTYDVVAVYGGGNQADYKPTSSTEYAEVLIEGCELTSIDAVYGGGNAAAVPATKVQVNGTHVINRLFGGGNGSGNGNPGANVGVYANVKYGTGKAETKLNGGYINSVFGGSNTKGDIAGGTDVKTKEKTETAPAGCCDDLIIGELYGAGSQADVVGGVNITLECMPDDYVAAVYGGAKNANIDGNVRLTVTSGKFGRVFGGNNEGGTIKGSITVYVREEGCQDLEIGELFGGGNLAPYSKFGCYLDNTDNKWKAYEEKSTANGNFEVTFDNNEQYPYHVKVFVESCTSIGSIYGGGLGTSATVTGDTYVNVNMLYGSVNNTQKTSVGRIGQVFGGGKQADVKGSTRIDIGTEMANERNGVIITKTIDDNTKYLNPEPTGTTGYSSVPYISIGEEAGVYGGGKDANVLGNATLNIGTKNLADGTSITGNIFGGGYGSTTKVTGDVTVNIGKKTGNDTDGYTYAGYASITGDVYGGSAMGKVNTIDGTSANDGKNTNVNLYGGTVDGSVYGGGLGDNTSGSEVAANVYGPVTVTVEGGTALNVFGCNNKYGAPQQSSVTVNINGTAEAGVGNVYGGGNLAAYAGSPVVTMNGGTAANVFGGGLSAEVSGSVTVNIKGGTVTNDVYGGGALANTNTGNTTNTSDKTTKVFLLGGIINNNVYGGGLGEKNLVNGKTADNPAYVNGDVKVYLNGIEIADYEAAKHSTLVTVVDADGNGTNDYYHTNDNTGCVVKGSIFGCNNLCGTPKGKVKVHIFKTQGDGASHKKSTDKKGGSYELTAVYGGGNMAAYEPTISGTETENNHAHTDVIIEGCDLTSIQYVYGGGNAASTPATNVTVNGSYEIGEVFGGGNGADNVPISYNNQNTQENPGANVGFKEYGAAWASYANPYDTKDNRATHYGYGFGKAQVNINGGLVHAVYGGSNSKGNVREVAIAMLDHVEKTCDFKVDEAYGGGKSADMDGRAVLQLGCVPSVTEVYGGAKNANVNGDVELTITNGTYDRVFGGNNEGGTINGSITVNIEETGCEKIIIGQLFAGGNKAAYTTPSGKDDPVINVKSFTSIGQIFGGGFGSTAILTGNPTIYIDEIVGDKAEEYAQTTFEYDNGTEVTSDDYTVVVPAHTADKIGTIGDVYGGGYGADVVGNVTVNIGTQETITFAGAAPSRTGLTITDGKYNVAGVHIARSVYGGGYGANTTVTGDVKVNVGGQKTDGTFVGGTITIGGSVYGGSALGAVNATRDANDNSKLNPTANKTTAVTLKKGNVSRYVFGGGQGEAPSGTNTGTKAHVYGKSTVTLYGDVVAGGLYGGCDANGEMHGDTQLDLLGGTVGTVLAATDEIPNMVFGGGLGKATTVDGNVTVNVGSSTYAGNTSVTIWGSVYGGGALGSVNTNTDNTTLVNLFKGVVNGNVFGGGLGDINNAAGVKGNATVKLNENNGTCEVTGSIFGCNNTKGTPEGHVLVHVFKTNKTGNTKDANKTTVDERWSENATYDLNAVYGGGNKADYEPTSATDYAEVIIEGCDLTSIKEVYGGGFGAAVPATQVQIKGTYLINEVFGGGYGAGANNNGANVGYRTYTSENDKTAYGNGKTKVELYGGKVHTIYGGSNTRGNIREGTAVDKMTDQQVACSLEVKNIYGAGKNADQDAGTTLAIGCIPGLKNVYGGAKDANIKGGVNMVITGGTFENVFGGNDTSGTIQGPIKLYIEEVCEPLIIDNLYLGGNQAPYSIYGYYQDGTDANNKPVYKVRTATDTETEKPHIGTTAVPYANPQLYVTSFTRIGNVFGGGYGSGAYMHGSPTININQIEGAHAVDGALGEIGNVFGGGNEAEVIGNTTINIGTAKKVVVKTDDNNEHDVLGANITGNVYGGGNLADVTGNTQVNICSDFDQINNKYVSVAEGTKKVTIGGDVFGAGKGVDTDVTKALVEGNSTIVMGNGSVKKSVYGGGELSQVAGNTDVSVIGGIIGTPKNGNTVYGGATYGNVYGGGKGNTTDVAAGLIKGNTKIAISNGTILHNIYGGGAYGSVGEFDYNATTGLPTGLKANTTGGNAEIYITGGTIGTTGKENGMIFGSSRGDVGGPGEIHDKLAWVYDTHVAIGDTTENATITTETPLIKGSVYGGGENGHNFRNAYVRINGGTIGIASGEKVTSGGKEYEGAAYPYRGNVYGGGCGTDKYYSKPELITEGHTAADGEGDKYNPLAGIVQGNAIIHITAGTVVHNVYGAGAMGSVGKTDANGTITSGGKTTIDISGGTIGIDGTVGDGNVYGAARGDKAFTNKDLALVKETSVTISGTTQIKGNVYGGGEVGNVHTNTRVNIQGGAIAKNVFGGGKGVEDLFSCEQAMVGVDGEGADATLTSDANKDKGTIVTISNGTVGTLNSGNLVEGTGNVYGGGEIGRVEWNTQVKIGVGTGNGSFAPIIYGNVFGAGKGLETHGYSALVRGNSTVTVQGSAKVLKNVYGGGEKSTVGRYWVKGINDNVTGAPTAPTNLPDGMPYQQQSGGICSVTVQGSAQIGPDAGATDDAGHVFGAGKGVNPHFVASGEGVSQKMTQTGLVPFTATTEKTAEELYLEFLETLALVTNSNVTIDGSATIKGSVYGGSENGFVQHNTSVLIQNGSTIGASNSYGNVYGGGKGYNGFAEAGRVSGTTTLNINGGTAYGSVYGGGELGFVKGAVNVNVTGGTVTKDVYGGGALADTNTENWNGTTLVSPYHEEIGLTAGTSVVTGLYTKDGDSYTEITAANTKAASGTTYYRLTETKVNLLGGTINGDAYGGGLGRLAATNVTAIEAKVYGDVAVNLGKAKADGTADLTAAATAFDVTYYTDEGHTDVVKSGRIFGCNNLNGSPKGNVTVTVNKTVSLDADGNIKAKPALDSNTYELADVYGGGNLANYEPADGKVKVIINSCDVSVQEVYGGGNAAAVPATDVEVRGAYEIAMVFGGGNGKDDYYLNGGWQTNQGANVGGNATTLLTGGYIHEAYGGSNSKGTISGNINISKGSGGCCTLNVVELYGAGKDADVEGDLIMVMGCSETRTEAVYGCAKNANVKGNMELTITSGEYGRVFGGNNESGAIFGHIVINVEETGCTPIIIDELYGCGNDAAYSTYGYYQDGNIPGTDKPKYVARTANDTHEAVTFEGKPHTVPPYDDPEINIYSCTRIGKVFGGGYGEGATVYGNPKVNINMMPGQYAVDDKLGVIGNVFGGGNEASVEGNSTVNIGNKIGDKVDIAILDNNGNPVKDNSGKYTYTEKTVTGARIVGNVFGGGNLATINGSTLVKIGTEGKDNELVSVNCLANTTEKPDNEVNTGLVVVMQLM